MRSRTLAGLALSLTTAAAAQEQVHVTLNWLEVTAGSNTPVPTPNGILEPGEAARFSVTVLVTPPIGSTATYTPPPPPGTGTIAGFGTMWMDLVVGTPTVPSPSGAGSWAFIARAPAWALGGTGMSSHSGAYYHDLQAGQFILPGGTANSANPIPDIWRGVWTPTDYSARFVTWKLFGSGQEGSALSILIRYGTDPLGNPEYIGKFVPGTYGSTTIPIIPAPASLLALSALLLQRRTRGP